MKGGIIVITVISSVVMPEGEKQNNADAVSDSQAHWWREQLELMTWKLFLNCTMSLLNVLSLVFASLSLYICLEALFIISLEVRVL